MTERVKSSQCLATLKRSLDSCLSRFWHSANGFEGRRGEGSNRGMEKIGSCDLSEEE